MDKCLVIGSTEVVIQFEDSELWVDTRPPDPYTHPDHTRRPIRFYLQAPEDRSGVESATRTAALSTFFMRPVSDLVSCHSSERKRARRTAETHSVELDR